MITVQQGAALSLKQAQPAAKANQGADDNFQQLLQQDEQLVTDLKGKTQAFQQAVESKPQQKSQAFANSHRPRCCCPT